VLLLVTVAVGAATLLVKNPGPADFQTKLNAFPTDLFVTMFSTLAGELVKTLRMHELSAVPFASRSTDRVAANRGEQERRATARNLLAGTQEHTNRWRRIVRTPLGPMKRRPPETLK